MKTIGILGGLGPQATTDFIDRIHRVSQKLIPPKTNSGYPPLLVYYFRHAPMLLDERHMPIEPWKPDPRLFEAAKLLRGADFLAIPSNAPHMFREGIETAAETPILSIIDQALAEVDRRGWKRVGVVGMGEPLVYTVPMKKKGLDCETLASDPDLRSQLDVAILKVMEGGEGDAERALARKAIEHVKSKKVDGVILGCTELPLLLGAAAEASEFVNTTQVLAEAAVRRAIA